MTVCNVLLFKLLKYSTFESTDNNQTIGNLNYLNYSKYVVNIKTLVSYLLSTVSSTNALHVQINKLVLILTLKKT